MPEKNNLQEIREELGKLMEQNIMPALEEVNDKLALIESQMPQLVTREYLDDKLADLEGSVIVRQRKEDKKVNLLIEILKDKKVVRDSDIKRLKEIKVFPDPREELM